MSSPGRAGDRHCRLTGETRSLGSRPRMWTCMRQPLTHSSASTGNSAQRSCLRRPFPTGPAVWSQPEVLRARLPQPGTASAMRPPGSLPTSSAPSAPGTSSTEPWSRRSFARCPCLLACRTRTLSPPCPAAASMAAPRSQHMGRPPSTSLPSPAELHPSAHAPTSRTTRSEVTPVTAMSPVTPQRDLSLLTRPSGAFAMLAVDQREAMRNMFAEHQQGPVADDQVTSFKLAAARILSKYASGVLVDKQFAFDRVVEEQAVAPGCGLIAAADHFIPAHGEVVGEVQIDSAVVPDEVKAQGAVALKL